MLDITDELRALVNKLDEQNIEYALCGGMAMGVHGFARTTIDIDLMILSESTEAAIAIAEDLGYTIRGMDLSFKMARLRFVESRKSIRRPEIFCRWIFVSHARTS